MTPLRIHAGATEAERSAAQVRLWVGVRCALGPTLVVPLRLLWRDYSLWCQAEGHRPAPAAAFKTALADCPWATVVDRPNARGRFRSLVQGVGLRAD
jgi:hypothetical protein